MKFTSPSINQSHRIPQLDGLRGLAILLVITFHYFGGLSIFSFGWTGVDLFFVISGFLITSRLLKNRDTKNYIFDFFRNRVLRIFPLYYAVLLLFFLAVFFLAKPDHMKGLLFYKQHWLSFFIFLQNWTFIIYGLPHDSLLQHFWTLAVEEQFYLVWPFLIYYAQKPKIKFNVSAIAVIFIIAIVFIRTMIYHHHVLDIRHDFYIFYFYNTFCRLDSFIIGSLSYVLFVKQHILLKKIANGAIIISTSLICAGILFYKSSRPATPFFSTIGYTFLATGYAGILLNIITGQHTFLRRFFMNRFLIFCGKISYGLYIFHWLVLLFFSIKINNWLAAHLSWNIDVIHYLSLLVCIGVTFIISLISFVYFESYFLGLKKKKVNA
jgi:peptidoglycan/LPS O-acetylase OafA/YrhL